MKDLKVVYYINGKNEEFANWMRYVNCSRNEEEQNMIAYQFHGKIFYRVYKDVEAGTEFLVWYGEEYAGELGIALEEEAKGPVQGNKCTNLILQKKKIAYWSSKVTTMSYFFLLSDFPSTSSPSCNSLLLSWTLSWMVEELGKGN